MRGFIVLFILLLSSCGNRVQLEDLLSKDTHISKLSRKIDEYNIVDKQYVHNNELIFNFNKKVIVGKDFFIGDSEEVFALFFFDTSGSLIGVYTYAIAIDTLEYLTKKGELNGYDTVDTVEKYNYDFEGEISNVSGVYLGINFRDIEDTEYLENEPGLESFQSIKIFKNEVDLHNVSITYKGIGLY